MKKHEEQFLFILNNYFNCKQLPEGYEFDMPKVVSLAAVHNLVPVLYEAVCFDGYKNDAFSSLAVKLFGEQALKNTVFESVYRELEDEGIDVTVLKGPVCALCYPNYDARLSSDFDIVVPEDSAQAVRDFFARKGYECKDESFFDRSTGLYIEMSHELSESGGELRDITREIFKDYLSETTRCRIYKTLDYTQNLVYLIYHAFKHFVGSGFGVRQVIDIALFTKEYYDKINFDEVFSALSLISAEKFARCIYYSACKKLGFELTELASGYDDIDDCCEEFLDDLLAAGVFGKSSEDRVHSAVMVKAAVENKGKKKNTGTLFPSYSYMKKRYNILKFLPVLLPLFWFIRIVKYFFRSASGKNNVSPKRSILIAESRLALMKKMCIIE